MEASYGFTVATSAGSPGQKGSLFRVEGNTKTVTLDSSHVDFTTEFAQKHSKAAVLKMFRPADIWSRPEVYRRENDF